MKELFHDLTYTILAKTKELTKATGIFGLNFLTKGFHWETLRPHVMKLADQVDSLDFIEVR